MLLALVRERRRLYGTRSPLDVAYSRAASNLAVLNHVPSTMTPNKKGHGKAINLWNPASNLKKKIFQSMQSLIQKQIPSIKCKTVITFNVASSLAQFLSRKSYSENQIDHPTT